MFPRILIITAILISVCTSHSQIRDRSFREPRSVDNVLSARDRSPDAANINKNIRGNIPLPFEENEPVFSDRNFTLDYSFKHKNAKDASRNETDSHTVEPSIYLEWAGNLGLTAGFIYQRSDSLDNVLTKQSSDAYGPDVTLDWEFGHFLVKKQSGVQLWFEPNVSYSSSTASKRTAAAIVNSDAEEYDLVPAFLVIKEFSAVTLTLRPSYAFAISRTTMDDGSPNQNTHGGVFTFLTRADYAIPGMASLKLIALAAWNHDVNQTGAGPLRDWATFGGGLKWTAKKWSDQRYLALQARYTYDAFHPDFEAHGARAMVEFHF